MKWGLAALVSVVMAFAGHLAFLQVVGNFHEVVPGALYRAAQMDGQALARWHRDYGIATVLNLRGSDTGADWYETERAVSDRLGMTHLDYAMSAARDLPEGQIAELVDIMRDAPKPLLIHCRSGADRTGLAAALYVMALGDGDEEAAERQLSLRFGHISLPLLSHAWPMDVTWERAESWLGIEDS